MATVGPSMDPDPSGKVIWVPASAGMMSRVWRTEVRWAEVQGRFRV